MASEELDAIGEDVFQEGEGIVDVLEVNVGEFPNVDGELVTIVLYHQVAHVRTDRRKGGYGLRPGAHDEGSVGEARFQQRDQCVDHAVNAWSRRQMQRLLDRQPASGEGLLDDPGW
jgi:hypothetical protein